MNQIVRTPQQVGAIVQRQRRNLRQTQHSLGSQIRHRQATISSLESGQRGTSLNTLFDVLAALDLELVVRTRTKGSAKDIEALS